MIVYTAIIDNYDTLKKAPKGYECVCFTNTDIKSDEWRIEKVKGSGVKLAREIKIRPDIYIGEDSLWIDANIEAVKPQKEFKDFLTMKHPSRDCILQEVEACSRLGKDKLRRMTKQVQRYKGYPQHNGLIASGVIYRRYNDKVNELNNLWWDEVKRGSHRDQLSFNYCAWLLDFEYETFDFMDGFKYYKHG